MKIDNVSSRKEVLKFIAKSSIYGNLGLFVGAGLSMAVVNLEGWDNVALSWEELIKKCAKSFGIEISNFIKSGQSYPQIASILVSEISNTNNIEYQEALDLLKVEICKFTSWYPSFEQRKKFGSYLSIIDPSWIITTNYDLILECLLTGNSVSLSPENELMSAKGIIPIYHLHGIRTNPNSIVITQDDYISLFRPNEYRHTKLPLTIKESTTLILGYGLGDINVLTAVDWSKNVFRNPSVNYPQEIIQVVKKTNPKQIPYRDYNDIIIIEIDSMDSFLAELSKVIKAKKARRAYLNAKLQKLNEEFGNPNDEQIENFIRVPQERVEKLNLVGKYDVSLISGFLELFYKAVDKTWEYAQQNKAFWAYELNLKLNLDILIHIEFEKIPAALMEAIAYNLNTLANYIGYNPGQSFNAADIWDIERSNIDEKTIEELKCISKVHCYYSLKKLLETK